MPDGSAARKIRFPRLCIQLVCALALWLAVACVHAASIYQCVDAHGHLAYRDTPCAPHARQNKLDVQPLPTIGDPAEVTAQRSRQTKANRRSAHDGRHAHTAHTTRRRANTKQEMSWECRAADGEVFYRHARCPSSVPGDGVVRDSYEENMASTRRRGRGRRDAWAGVRVHGKKVTRAEACRRIHAAGAAGRDGHQRDQTVSTYDHLMGRDPCGD
ncbi:MAG: DUF4124 domain-containing protein [Rhodanobacteraceae bacterium]